MRIVKGSSGISILLTGTSCVNLTSRPSAWEMNLRSWKPGLSYRAGHSIEVVVMLIYIIYIYIGGNEVNG